MKPDVVIVGAGVAGLACARKLVRSGAEVLVLEKSRGLGGRCATRRVESQPIDLGPAFYHGDDPGFLAQLRAVDDERVEGWPRRILGSGRACQPRAFRGREQKIAFVVGMTAFPKWLGRGLQIQRESGVTAWRPLPGAIEVVAGPAGILTAPTLVLALPAPQTARLLGSVPDGEQALRSSRSVVELIHGSASLTLAAGYDLALPELQWDMRFPEDSRILLQVGHDSSKRRQPRFRVLTYQGSPAWSRDRWGHEAENWQREMIDEAGRILGDWARRPLWVSAQRWRFSQAAHDAELTRPLLVRLRDGGLLGICGEAFAPGGGTQGAWGSGEALARRIEEEVG